jgi:hypothetical protein
LSSVSNYYRCFEGFCSLHLQSGTRITWSLKMEATNFSETLVNIVQNFWRPRRRASS